MGSTNWGRVSGKLCHDPVLSYKILAPLSHLCCALHHHFPRFSLSFVSLVQASPRFCPISDPISHFRLLFPCDRCGVRAFNYAFPRASADILVQISPTHGIGNGNGNPSSIITRGRGHGLRTVEDAMLNDSPQEIACPLLLPPSAASRPFREMRGLCSLPRNVPVYRVGR